MFPYVSGHRLVVPRTVPYADLTFASMTLPNHEYIDLNGADDVCALGRLASEFSAAGMNLVTYHARQPNCVSGLACPSSSFSRLGQTDWCESVRLAPCGVWKRWDAELIGLNPSNSWKVFELPSLAMKPRSALSTLAGNVNIWQTKPGGTSLPQIFQSFLTINDLLALPIGRAPKNSANLTFLNIFYKMLRTCNICCNFATNSNGGFS
ncbi:hypothetical protein B0H14DRAFT_2565078 [Mycena olivaceomarginata]|nr:hypothetical protein B0H14DRAFT_2565078 [Mycena olivaceomarginata]